jgi:hypothetical protein
VRPFSSCLFNAKAAIAKFLLSLLPKADGATVVSWLHNVCDCVLGCLLDTDGTTATSCYQRVRDGNF